jgi:hypothetical protein
MFNISITLVKGSGLVQKHRSSGLFTSQVCQFSIPWFCFVFMLSVCVLFIDISVLLLIIGCWESQTHCSYLSLTNNFSSLIQTVLMEPRVCSTTLPASPCVMRSLIEMSLMEFDAAAPTIKTVGMQDIMTKVRSHPLKKATRKPPINVTDSCRNFPT